MDTTTATHEPETTTRPFSGQEIAAPAPSTVPCPLCKPVVRKGGKGRPASYHPKCAELERDVQRLERGIGDLHATLQEGEPGTGACKWCAPKVPHPTRKGRKTHGKGPDTPCCPSCARQRLRAKVWAILNQLNGDSGA